MATELYELSVQGNHNGQFIENVLHFQGDNLTINETFPSGRDLVASWTTNIKALWLACLPATYTLDRLAARRVIAKPSAVYHTQNQRGTNPGTFGSVAASYQLCPTVFLVPPSGIKSGGKIFMPAIDITAINGNIYTAPYIAAINAMMSAATNNFGVTAITWQQAIFSRKLISYSLVSAWTLSTRIGFQSRRRKPVGA
jgi:hypothetical protein